jgi:putative oxidoreductase
MTPSKLATKWSSAAPYLHSLLRMVAAFMFMLAGTKKLFAYPAATPRPDPAHLFSQVWVGGVLETFGGALLLVGLCTRPVAFVLAGEMAVAYFQFHFHSSLWPTLNGGVAAALYCFIWLYMSAAGPGPVSLEARWRRS